MIITAQTLGLNFTEAYQLTSADRRNMLVKAKSLGTLTVRVEVPWGLIEKSKGVYDWSLADPMFADLGAAGMDALVVIAHGPGQTSPGKGLSYGWFSTPSPIDFAKFCSALAQRYPWVKNYEIFNEQNVNVNWPKADPKTWTPYLIAAYQALKTPNRVIALGGLAACPTYSRGAFFWIPAVYTQSPVDFLAGVHSAGGRKFYDVVSYHPYPLLDDYSTPVAPSPTQKFVDMTAKLYVLAQRPVWCTEYGFSVAKFTAVQQAEYLTTETKILAGMEGVGRLYPYCLRDNNGFNFGLFANTGARPAVAAYSQLFGLGVLRSREPLD